MSTNPPLAPRTKNKLSSLVVMGSVAVFLALIAAIGIWQYLIQAQQKVKELSATRPVVIASKEIPTGTKLSETDLAIKQLPEKAIPKDYPSSVESLKGRIVKTTLKPEEIITESLLVQEGAAGGLPIVIPKGQRAITIQVNEVKGVGGFINPGDRVDILAVQSKSEERAYSKTILQNVLVLAVGENIIDPNRVLDPKPKIVSQVTVALTPEDSEKLILAAQTGDLHLVLRPFGEGNVASTEGVDLQGVYGFLAFGDSSSQTPNLTSLAATPSTEIKRKTIEIILGNQRSYFYY